MSTERQWWRWQPLQQQQEFLNCVREERNEELKADGNGGLDLIDGGQDVETRGITLTARQTEEGEKPRGITLTEEDEKPISDLSVAGS